jgi:hypothetical protein
MLSRKVAITAHRNLKGKVTPKLNKLNTCNEDIWGSEGKLHHS